MVCARTGLLPSEQSWLAYFLGLHVAQVTELARFQGGLPEGIAAVESDVPAIRDSDRHLHLHARHERLDLEATLGVCGDLLAEGTSVARGTARVGHPDAEHRPRPGQAILVEEPSRDCARGDELDLQRGVGLQVFVLEHGRPDELAGLVREDQQPRVARLQTPDLEGIGVERRERTVPDQSLALRP